MQGDSDPRLLVVDDDDVERRLIQSVLGDRGIGLDFACTGQEALAKAEETAPDLILLDVMMPGMDGFEVCRRLRASPSLASVPIVMVTALDDRGSRLHGLEAGADDFLSKPYDIIELRARVQTILKLNRFRQLVAERSKRQELEKEASKHSKLEAIGRAARGMAHDFKSYLAAIRIRTDLILQKIESGRPDPADVQAISRAVQEAREVIDGILTFARDQDVTTWPLDLGTLVRDLEPSIEDSRIPPVELKVTTFASPLVVHGNPIQLRRVVMNLVQNAFDAVASDGHVEVRTEWAEVPPSAASEAAVGRPRPHAILAVEDDGCGIATENSSRPVRRSGTTAPS